MSPWRLAIGIIIILIGLQFLAANLGWSWAWSINFWQLWPIFIILIGLSMLSRGGRMHAGLGWLIALVLIGGAITYGVLNPVKTEVENQDIALAQRDGATAADVSIDMGAAKVTVGGGSDQLVTGTFSSNITSLQTSDSLSNDTQEVSFTAQDRGHFWFFGGLKNELDLNLTDDLPMSLTVDSGAADLNFDLSTLMLQRLDIDSGASTLDLTLGDKLDATEVNIDSGAASLTIDVPETVGMKVYLDAGASSKHLPDSLQKTDDDTYETKDFNKAEKQITLTISAGASTITINTY